jgi:hypothetical protein
MRWNQYEFMRLTRRQCPYRFSSVKVGLSRLARASNITTQICSPFDALTSYE